MDFDSDDVVREESGSSLGRNTGASRELNEQGREPLIGDDLGKSNRSQKAPQQSAVSDRNDGKMCMQKTS